MLNKSLLTGAVAYTILLAVLSLISTDNVPKIDIEVSDKVMHFLAYAVLALIWHLALSSKQIKVNLFWLTVGCIIYGIILELIQGELKTHRTADFYDVLANSIGVLLVIIVLFFRQRQLVKNT